MKKWLSIAFLTMALFLLAMPVYADTTSSESDCEQTANITEEYLTVVCGAKTVTCENEIIREGDLTFLPLREVLQAYGAQLSWAEGEAETKVIITAGQDRCQLVLDLEKQVAYASDDKTYSLQHIDSTLYLPVHFFVQMVNCAYTWDGDASVLTLHADQVKEDAQKKGADGTVNTYSWIMNLPAYEKTVASRSSGVRSDEIYETGIASYYGSKFHGRGTASGERYDKNAFTAAHKTLPFGTIVRVTAEWNQKTVDVRINDRGPYSRGRVIDLSTAAAAELGMLSKGLGNVTLEVISRPAS